MEKVKILIVEDDMIIAADISMQLTRMGYDITGILPRGEDALDHVAQNTPDIILMDIMLKGEMDGVETAQKIYERFQIPLIFLTGNTDEATFNRAKVARPEAYISKPFKKLDLVRAIDLVVSKIQEADAPKLRIIEGNDRDTAGKYLLDDRIFVRLKDRMVKIYIKDILFAEAERNYCRVQTADREYLMTVPLKAFEDKLQADEFFRVHCSFVINLTKIDELSDTYLVIGKKKIPVSKSHRAELMDRLKLF